ncbi:MAG: alpha/beta fold hydrolase [Elusimicrobiota bacterium]|nr:alpha/beta fold hydrolase [Elusimicrobiota bacterium]
MPLGALLLPLALAAAAPAPKPPPFLPKPAKAVGVSVESGSRRLAASWRAPRRGMPVLVLAHGVGAGKGEWERFASRLAARGFGTLCLDLRGHGGSAASPDEWKGFDRPGGWAPLKDDLLAAAAWLEGRKIEPARIAFGGASIGANLAAAADAERPGRFLLLLSPGADYRGVKLTLRKGAKALAVAARADAYAFATLGALSEKGATVLEAPGGHGAPMLDDEATMGRVLDWLSKPR